MLHVRGSGGPDRDRAADDPDLASAKIYEMAGHSYRHARKRTSRIGARGFLLSGSVQSST